MSIDRSVLQQARMVAKTFATNEGKETLKLMRQMFSKRESYVKGDTHDTAYREGRRAVILWIENKLAAAKVEVKDDEEG